MEEVGLLENGAKLISADLYTGRATGVLCCGPKGRGTVKQIFSSLVQTSGFVMQNGGSRMQEKFAVWVRDSGKKTYSRI